jgi:hypothetical protein
MRVAENLMDGFNAKTNNRLLSFSLFFYGISIINSGHLNATKPPNSA